jgi:ESS family glutamate:Na+ symporter
VKFEIGEIGLALAILALLVLGAATLRRRIPYLRSLFIPNAITAGLVGLLLGPQVLGALVDSGRVDEGLFGATTMAIWNELPGLLINVVFASILLGKRLPGPRKIWDASASQALFGFTLSFGQYALGMMLAAAVLVPVFDMNEASGALLEISFTGGHGTAAGLRSTMTENGFAEGADLALGLATVGLLGGLLVGTLLINRAVRSERIEIAREREVEFDDPHDLDVLAPRIDIPERDEPDPATSALTVTIGAISGAIMLGWLLQQLLIGAEAALSGNAADDTFIGDIPLFPFTIIGGASVQILLTIRGWSHLVSRTTVNQTSGLALDLLIAAAIATLSLSTIGDNLAPFVLMCIVAIAWSTAALLWLAPLFYGPQWFERGIGDFGQSSGTVASGFMLVDMSDPQQTSGARDSYGYKQLLFEPFLGGGLLTALSIPLLVQFGLIPSLIASTLLTLLMIGLGIRRARAA